MDRLRFLERRFNAEVALVPTTIHALLTREDGGASVIYISTLLDRERQLAAAATMLQVLARDWPGRQHAFMFPRPNDSAEVVAHLAFARRSYRGPYRDGLRVLMPDAWMEAQERGEVDPRVSAAEAGVSLADYFFRTVDWLSTRKAKPKGMRADVDWLLANRHIKRASELPPPAPRRPKVEAPSGPRITDRALLPMMFRPEDFAGPPRPDEAPDRRPSLLDPSTRSQARRQLYAELFGAVRFRAGRYPAP